MVDKTALQQGKRGPGRQFQKGQSGNPAGRPKGSRHKATILAQNLLDGEAESLARKIIEMALNGDTTCLRVCIERLVPARKDSPVTLELPEMLSAVDIPVLTASLLKALSKGEITPSEAQTIAYIADFHRKALETADLESRIQGLEEKVKVDEAQK